MLLIRIHGLVRIFFVKLGHTMYGVHKIGEHLPYILAKMFPNLHVRLYLMPYEGMSKIKERGNGKYLYMRNCIAESSYLLIKVLLPTVRILYQISYIRYFRA